MTVTSTTLSVLKIGRWIFLSAVVVLALWNVYWLFTAEPEHDEVEHFHAAWLMYKGETPFYDFFEHHSPALWMILRLYYDIFGENFGIILTARASLFVIFILTLWVIYQTARQWTTSSGGWLAALGFPLLSINYLQAHTLVRGDPLILLLIMMALCLAVPLAERKLWERAERQRLLLIFICLALALFISPRAGIPALTLFLVLGFLGIGALPLFRLVLTFFVGGLIVLLPTLVIALAYGFEVYLFWVYKFSALLEPAYSPLPVLITFLRNSFPLWILVALGLIALLRAGELRQRRSLWLLLTLSVTGFFGLWACRHPYMQHFLMTIPFFGLVAGLGYDRLMEFLRKHTRLFNWNVAAALLFAFLVLLTIKTGVLRRHPANQNYSYWVQRAQWLIQHNDTTATFAGGVAYASPIFRQDAFYYWFAARYGSLTLQTIRTDYQPYTFRDLRRERPTILHESFATGWGMDQLPEYQLWLEKNYEATLWRGYWLLKNPEFRIQNSE